LAGDGFGFSRTAVGDLMETKPFQVVYNSDLIIRDRSEAACLCLFYDKVYLPWTDEGSCNRLLSTETRSSAKTTNLKDWELEYATLFEAGILQRLGRFSRPDEYDNTEGNPEWHWHPDCISGQCREIALRPKGIPHDACWITDINPREWGTLEAYEEVLYRKFYDVTFHSPTAGTISRKVEFVTAVNKGTLQKMNIARPRAINQQVTAEEISGALAMPVRKIRMGGRDYIPQDLADHLVRTDVDLPQIFATTNGQRPGRDILVALEAEATFGYLLPIIRVFHPTQILELREKIADTREGFTMHLWRLSKGLEERVNAGTRIAEIRYFAKSLIETELIPDYREFRRQLSSMKVGRWGKVLDAGGRVFDIDATIGTPKFYGLLLKAVGLSGLTLASERQELLSNRVQAFKFMTKLEHGPN
jgi:hypothetical protein